MQFINEIPVWGEPVQSEAVEQMKVSLQKAQRAAIMADHHLGYNSLPVGGVIAYKYFVSPSGVGSDIACGNKAVRLDVPAARVRNHISDIMDKVFKNISFGMGRVNDTPVESAVLDDPLFAITHGPLGVRLKDLAVKSLGTVGSGNHYLDIFADEQDRVWVGCHFGSRGVGYKIAHHFVRDVGGVTAEGPYASPVVFYLGSDKADEYLQWMHLAGRYAYAGRDWVCAEVARILGGEILEEVHNHHNFAWFEEHAGEQLCVVRKGCTPAFPGQKGFVGGSMGDISVILEGVDTMENKLGLCSTVHGAGRSMGRMEAKGKKKKIKDERGQWTGKWEVSREPRVTRESMQQWVSDAGVELRGADVDESPHCYKRLPEVLAHHKDSVRILHTLKPIGVAMAPSNVFDPYAD
ncbi:MAG: RtcB family protein [Candidatus Sumerlaeota bacterium]